MRNAGDGIAEDLPVVTVSEGIREVAEPKLHPIGASVPDYQRQPHLQVAIEGERWRRTNIVIPTFAVAPFP